MSREEFIDKLYYVLIGDRNAFNDIVCAYDSVLCKNEKAVEYIDRETGKGIYESGYGRGTAVTICKEHLLNILQNGSDEE